jgi:hypothetical protein
LQFSGKSSSVRLFAAVLAVAFSFPLAGFSGQLPFANCQLLSLGDDRSLLVGFPKNQKGEAGSPLLC